MDTFRLSDLLSLSSVQKMADAHYLAAGMPIGIIDAADGVILVGAGWQKICTRFHRANPETRKRCHASDNYIKDNLMEGEATGYKCQNGLWDIGIPILVAGRHLATMFLGQFFYEGEMPERAFFIRQAETFGFDRDEYLAALDQVPVFTREKVDYILEYNKALVGFITDIAQQSLEKREAEAALKKSEERLRLSLSGSGSSLWEWMPDSGEIYFDGHWMKMTGLDPGGEPIDFGSWLERVHVDSRPLFRKALNDYLGGKAPRYELEYRIRTSSGGWKWIWFAGECVEWDKDNRPRRFLGIQRDISDAKEAEEKFCMLNESLERRINDRTLELEKRNRQLQKLALDLAEAEDRERQNIASILHDDFQQQLAYIKIELNLMGKDTAEDPVRERLAFLEQLIGECINKSRNFSYELSPPALNRDGLFSALEILANDMKAKHGLEVILRTAPGAAPASHSLASILYRAVKELLFNVVKHAGVASAIVDIDSRDGMIHIEVADVGRGFDYARIRSSQTGGGFGLYHIEDRMTFLGGAMAVDARPGGGCRVRLTVPKRLFPNRRDLHPPAGDAAGDAPGADTGAAAAPLDGPAPIRILMVDDHQLMREALAKLVHSYPWITVVGQAADGREAIELAARLKPDIILMDVSMPEVDGIQATAEISEHHPGIGIIGLSMHNDRNSRQKMFDAGANAYLTKTGSPEVLVETIRRVHDAGH